MQTRLTLVRDDGAVIGPVVWIPIAASTIVTEPDTPPEVTISAIDALLAKQHTPNARTA